MLRAHSSAIPLATGDAAPGVLPGRCSCCGFVVGNVEHQAEHGRREHLALRVRLERERAAAVERAVQEEVERMQIRKLISFDVAR